jgi:tetracycline 7-halogenase / FADH2 O2-dependent halogenase
VQVDLVIVGSGFGGSVMAMVARRLGLSVVLLEQGRHPRMAIGESTTPLSNLLLERICATYDLPRLAPLAKWGSWQRAYPQIACGLKRGFSFFCQGERLLVAASPRDDIADTHWFREEVDHFLVNEAQSLGVEYYDCVGIEDLVFTDESATLVGRTGDRPFRLNARLLIDATGPRGFLHRSLQLPESALPGMPLTKSLFSHFTGVGRTPCSEDTVPYPVDDAAVHHVFDGGWVWVLRFNNGVTSAGVAATQSSAAELKLSEGEPAWRRLLDRLPALRSQFAHATPCQPFRHMPAVSFRSSTIAGKRWAMLPSAAGFIDPLLSTGFTLTLQGVERLGKILQGDFDSAELSVRLQGYAEQTDCALMSASRLIGALYATMDNFSAFTAVSLLYFAAVSFSEAAFRLGKPELATGFLLPSASALLERAHALGDGAETPAFTEEVRRAIEPFNLGRFGDPTLDNQYPVRAEDLLDAGSKLGACRTEIVAMLERSGFCL